MAVMMDWKMAGQMVPRRVDQKDMMLHLKHSNKLEKYLHLLYWVHHRIQVLMCNTLL
jgi:hypothetical protein